MALPLTAGITRFPYGVSSFGMPVIGGGGLMTTGNVYYVSSTASGGANDTAHGLDPITPFKSVAYALGRVTASQGDVIFVMPGHSESVAGAGSVTFSAAGVRVVGLGLGRNRPTFVLSSSTAASIVVNAANCALENVVLTLTTTDGIINGIDVNAADFTLHDCEIVFASAVAQAVTALVTDANASRLVIDRCRFIGSDDAGATSAVTIAGTPDSIRITQSEFIGNVASGLIWNDTGNVATNLVIEDCYFRSLSGALGIILTSACTGVIRRNALAGDDLTTLLDPGACAAYENYGYDEDVADVTGVLLPTVGTSLGASRSLVDELLGASVNYNRTNYFAVTLDGTSATWNTVATHTIAVVTGTCRLRIVPVCGSDLGSGGAATLTLGHSTDADAFIASTGFDDLDTGTVWFTATPAAGIVWSSCVDVAVASTSVGYEIGTAALNAGTVVFHVWWEPLDSTGSVAAGDGSAL